MLLVPCGCSKNRSRLILSSTFSSPEMVILCLYAFQGWVRSFETRSEIVIRIMDDSIRGCYSNHPYISLYVENCLQGFFGTHGF